MPKGVRPKSLTQGKVDRARDALDALLECDNLSEFFGSTDHVKLIEAKNCLGVALIDITFQGRRKP